MMRTPTLLACLVVVPSVACGPSADCPEPAVAPSAQTTGGARAGAPSEPAAEPAGEGLDARLTGYAYPYDTRTFELEVQGRPAEMVYMDVSPEGEPRGTVVLLHGKNFSGAYWAPVVRGLREAGYRVVAPDQIGFGKSSKPTDVQYSFHAMASHTLALLDAIGVQRMAVVGHSMGGMLATRLALAAPGRVTKLALINPIGLEDWQRKVPYRTVSEIEEAELGREPGDVRRYMQAAYFDDEWEPAYEPLVEIQVGWIRGPDAARMARISALTYDMIFTQPVLYEWEDLEVPTLLIIGQRDRTALGRDRVPPEVAETLGRYPELGRRAAEAIPDAELVELDDIGHVPHYEDLDRTMEALLAFLDGAS